jgi:ankyrin repeat protein
MSHAHYKHEPQGVERMLAVTEQLLAAGAKLDVSDESGRPLFQRALDWSKPALLKHLLQRGLPMPDDALLNALKAAQDAASLESVEILLKAAQPRHLKARDDIGQSTAHVAAARRELLPLLQQMAGRGVDLKAVSQRGETVFAAAAFAANLPALQWLAGRGAMSMQADANGQTPLHLASYGPRPEVLRWLLAQGADLNARDKRGRRALDIAIANQRFAYRSPEQKLELVELLGGGPADVLRGRFSDHPLHQAIAATDLKRIEALLKQGADPNVRNASGHPPLGDAITACAWPASRDFGRKLLPLLLRYGADPRLPLDENEDETLIDHARTTRVFDVLEREMSRHSTLR